MGPDSERFSISAAQRGSEQAWRQLFECHFDAVYQFCVVLTGGRNALAEELTQQVFVVAAERIHRFDASRATFRAWLFGIVKNRYMAIQASKQRRKRYEESSVKRNSKRSRVKCLTCVCMRCSLDCPGIIALCSRPNTFGGSA